MSVFGGVICCISAFYEYGQNAAKQKGAPLVCLGLLPGGEYYTHDGANTDTQRRACLFSVVHVVHIRAGGVEALASCCIKGAFGLKKPPFRAWIRPRGGGVSVFGCPRCPYRARACNLFNVWRLSVLSIFVHIVPGVEALAAFCFVVDMDTQRGKYRHRPRRSCIRRRVAPLFGCFLLVGVFVPFCQNNSPCVV